MPPCWTRTQLSGCLYYPTCSSGGEPEQRDNGHTTQIAGVAALDNMGWTIWAGQWKLATEWAIPNVVGNAAGFNSRRAGFSQPGRRRRGP